MCVYGVCIVGGSVVWLYGVCINVIIQQCPDMVNAAGDGWLRTGKSPAARYRPCRVGV